MSPYATRGFAQVILGFGRVFSTLLAIVVCISVLPLAIIVLALYGWHRFIDG
jgi:hypothetical protein